MATKPRGNKKIVKLKTTKTTVKQGKTSSTKARKA